MAPTLKPPSALKSTGVALGVASLFAALLGAVFVLKAGLLATILYTFLIILVIARLMPIFWLKPIVCSRETSHDVVRIGEKVSITIKIKNTARWPILWLYAEESVPADMPIEGITKRLMFIPAGRSFFLNYQFIPTRRGCHALGPMVLESGDIFGLFKKCRIERHKEFVTALPAYYSIEEFQVGQHRRLGDMTTQRSIFEDPTRIRGVRDYRRGDPLNHIHWKSSARTGRLCTKVFDPVTEPGATIILDFHQDAWSKTISSDPDNPPSENAIEIACTIAAYLAEGSWKVGFFSNGRDPLGLPGVTMSEARSTESLKDALEAARIGREDDRLEPISIRASRKFDQFSRIHESLGRIELSDGLKLHQVILDEMPYIDRTQALLFITGDTSDKFIQTLAQIRSRGYRIMVFVVCNPYAHDKVFEDFTARGIEVYRMDEKWRLKELATGRQHF